MPKKKDKRKECCDKCFTTYTEHDYPAHKTYEACLNPSCECHMKNPKDKKEIEEEIRKLIFELLDNKINAHPALIVKEVCKLIAQAKKDLLDEVEKSKDKWAKQGRTEEQKWAVNNFLTGAFLSQKRKELE